MLVVINPPSLREAIALFIPLFLFLSASDPSLSLAPYFFCFSNFFGLLFI